MKPPREEVRRFLRGHGAEVELSELAGDASTRRFYRVRLADGTLRVVMDYGRAFVGPSDDQVLSRIFDEAGLRVARVLEADPAVGCLLLEDLGDRTLESALPRGVGPEDPESDGLFARAVRLAAAVAVRGTPVLRRSSRAKGPALDGERFRFEMEFFVEHYALGLRGLGSVPAELRDELARLAWAAAAGPGRVLCHRDFHSRNLLLLPDGELAMVDVQDARWGPDSYDLASLLRDAYLEIEESWIPRFLRVYLEALPEAPAEREFRRRLEVVAAQRMIKALGTFGYQAAVLGRREYLDGVPRTLRRLREALPGLEAAPRLFRLLDESGLLDA